MDDGARFAPAGGLIVASPILSTRYSSYDPVLHYGLIRRTSKQPQCLIIAPAKENWPGRFVL